MDSGDLDFSNTNIGGDFSGTCPLLDDILKDTHHHHHACTHTHTCNPPGLDYHSHTHSCFHVHTKILSPPPGAAAEDKVSTDDTTTAESSENKTKKKRPSGNREAVRKYREKKKARAASLEDEVLRLTALNQQLIKKLQSQAVLEAQVARLKCLLVDIRGRIDGEIGSFPYQNSSYKGGHISETYVMSPCNMQCNDQVYCRQSQVNGKCRQGSLPHGQDLSGCELDNMPCFGNQNTDIIKGFSSCGPGNVASAINSSGANKRKGGTCAPTTCLES